MWSHEQYVAYNHAKRLEYFLVAPTGVGLLFAC